MYKGKNTRNFYKYVMVKYRMDKWGPGGGVIKVFTVNTTTNHRTLYSDDLNDRRDLLRNTVR